MDWMTGLQQAIDYVEAHLTDDIDYAAAAKEAVSSSFHFQRVFSFSRAFYPFPRCDADTGPLRQRCEVILPSVR